MSTIQYYIDLRDDLINVITGVKDAGFSLYWDNTTTNFSTRKSLTVLYKNYLSKAVEFGLLVVTRYSDCKKHKDYFITNEYGLDIVYHDEKYVWEGSQVFQGYRNCICPCLKDNPSSKHYVIEDIIYDVRNCLHTCRTINLILSDIKHAIANSGNNQPRSGIREYLLRAVLQLNDAILPFSTDDYIAQCRKKIKLVDVSIELDI